MEATRLYFRRKSNFYCVSGEIFRAEAPGKQQSKLLNGMHTIFVFISFQFPTVDLAAK